MNHSIPDGVAVFIRTPVGNVLHTGDFKLDQTPIDGRFTDYGALAKAAKPGRAAAHVRLHQRRDTRATRSPRPTSARRCAPSSQRAEQRIIVRLVRLAHPPRAAGLRRGRASGRKVVVTGRSMVNNTTIARELGYLDIDDDDIVDAYDAATLPPEEIVVLCTGSQGEPLSALARMANGDHKTVQVEEGDTVVISAIPVPGNEKAVEPRHQPPRQGRRDVLHKGNADVHVSGHAASEELKLMLNLVQPRYFMPIHGETRHLRAHARLAEQRRHGATRTSSSWRTATASRSTSDGARLGGARGAGVVYVDGLTVGDVGQVVLRDRQLLAQRRHRHRRGRHRRADRQASMGDPELVTRGVAVGSDDDRPARGATARVDKTLAKTAERGRHRPGRHQARCARVALPVPLGARAPPPDDHPGRHGGLRRGAVLRRSSSASSRALTEFLPISSDGHLAWSTGVRVAARPRVRGLPALRDAARDAGLLPRRPRRPAALADLGVRRGAPSAGWRC